MPDLTSALTQFSANFSGRVLASTHSAWDTARRVHNGLIDKRPALIAQCLGSADIAQAIRFARDQGLEIAVRGGGHNVGGRATVDDGMMIDLSSLKFAHVDPVARTVRAGGGSLWGHLNRETQAHGLATTGGVVSSTGVAGLTLGGGLGWLMPKYGMALDNLLSAEMVLADGRIVRAAQDENPDLFWAVRGGGGNFGVASSLEFRLHDVGPIVMGGLCAWTADQAGDVFRLFRDLAAKADDDTMIVAALITAEDATTKLVAIGAAYIGGDKNGGPVLTSVKAFGSPVMDAIGSIPYTQLNAMLDASYPAGARNLWKAHFCETLSDEAIDYAIDAFMRCPSPMGQVLIEHFHGAAARVAPADTAYALRAPGFNVLMLSQWMNAADDAACTAWARDSYAGLQRFGGPRRYLNYLDHEEIGHSALAAAYGPNVARLQSIKATFDPDNVFHLNVNIPPKP